MIFSAGVRINGLPDISCHDADRVRYHSRRSFGGTVSCSHEKGLYTFRICTNIPVTSPFVVVYERRQGRARRRQPDHDPDPGLVLRPVQLGLLRRRLPDADRRDCDPERAVLAQARHGSDRLLRHGGDRPVLRGRDPETSRRHVRRGGRDQAGIRAGAVPEQRRQHPGMGFAGSGLRRRHQCRFLWRRDPDARLVLGRPADHQFRRPDDDPRRRGADPDPHSGRGRRRGARLCRDESRRLGDAHDRFHEPRAVHDQAALDL